MIGIIAGAFDVIHPGYILAFLEAKQYCSKLVVCLHDDPSVERPEKLKPLLTIGERTMILDSIKYVDEIIPYQTEADFLEILKNIDPHIRFLGQDYEIGIDKITGAELNIPYRILDRSHEWSATKFKKMIAESVNAPKKPSQKWPLTEEEWHITERIDPCWRCGNFLPLSKDHICLSCFDKEKA